MLRRGDSGHCWRKSLCLEADGYRRASDACTRSLKSVCLAVERTRIQLTAIPVVFTHGNRTGNATLVGGGCGSDGAKVPGFGLCVVEWMPGQKRQPKNPVLSLTQLPNQPNPHQRTVIQHHGTPQN